MPHQMVFGSSLVETKAIRIGEKEPYGLSAGYQPYRRLAPLFTTSLGFKPQLSSLPRGT